jgi:uncharacterized membrane protein
MKSLNNFALIYYGSISVIAIILISLLVVWLSWPILASSVLGAALFLHILNVARHARERYLNNRDADASLDLAEKFKLALGIPVATKNDSEA